MKKRLFALLLSVIMVVGLLPATALAETANTTVKLTVAQSEDYTYNSKNVVAVGFNVQSSDIALRNLQCITFAIDSDVFDLLTWDESGEGVAKSVTTIGEFAELSDAAAMGAPTKKSGAVQKYWDVRVYCAKTDASSSTVFVRIEPAQADMSYSVATAQTIATLYLGLAEDVTLTSIPSDAIRFATKEEAQSISQSDVVELTNGEGTILQYCNTNGPDTLAAPTMEWIGITPAKSALPTGAAATISYSNGTPVMYGHTLTASLSGVTDPGALTYKWYRTKDGTTTQIEGATASSYELGAADIGCTIKVEISAANYSGSVTSAETPAITKGYGSSAVEPDKKDLTATHNSITITGGTKVGQRYNVSTKAPGGLNTPTDGWQTPTEDGDPLTFTGLQSQKQYYILVRRPETDVYLESIEFTNKITTLKAPIDAVSATVAAPVKGEPLATSVTVDSTKYSGTVEWYEGNNADGTAVTGNAKVNTIYTAKITLTAKSGESFDSSGVTVTLNETALSAPVTPDTDGNLVVTKTFKKTADKDALPTGATLSYYFASTIAASSGSTDGKYGDLLHVEVTGLPDDCGKVTIKFDAIEGETSKYLGSIEANEITDHSVKTYRSMAMSADEIGKKLNITVTCENYSGSLTAQTPVIQKAPQTGSPDIGQVTNAYDYTTNTPVIRVSIAEGTQWALIEGSDAPDADTEWVDYPSSGMMVDGKRQYTFADLKPDTSYKVYARYAETATHLVGTNYGSVTVKTLVAAITDVSGVSVAAPVKGEALATGITGGDSTKYSGTVEWYEGNNVTGTAVTDVNAKANTVYTAKITLTADRTASTAADKQHFANNSFITVPSGYILSDNNHWVIVLTKTFPATLDKTLSSIKLVPTGSLPVPTKEEYNLYGENSGNCSITATYDDGSTVSGSDITTGVTWEILTTPHTGVALTEDGSGIARFAVDNTASWASITIRATYGGKSAEATISPVKATSELTSMTINGAATIAVPKAGEETKKETYTLSCEDQYGADMATPSGVTWSYTGLTPVTAGHNTQFDTLTRTLTVPSTAAANDGVTITAIYSSGASTVTATKSVSITREASVPTTVTIDGDGEVTIPAVKGDMTPDSTTANYTATVKDQYGRDMPDQSVTWSVSASDASISATGVLTVTSSTAQNTENKVTATVTGTTVSGEKTVKLMRSSPIVPKFVKIFKNGTEVTTDSIVIPGGEDINSASYTAKVYNQYGEEYEYALGWSLTDATGVKLNDESSPVQVKVANNASMGDLTLEAKATETVKATVSISLVNKLSATVAIDRSNATDVTYGTDFTLSATATDADGHALTGGTWTWSSGDASVLEITGGVNTDTVTISPKKAYNNSTTPVVITATYENDTHSGSTTTDFTLVNQRVITVGAGTAKVSKVYNGTTSVSSSDVTGEVSIDRTNVLAADNVASKLSVAYTCADCTSKDVHTGSVVFTFALRETASTNYKLSTTTVSVPCEITKKPISVSGADVSNKDYDGNRDATVTGVTFTGLVTGETLEKDTDYEVVSAAFPDADADASNVNVTVTVQLKDTNKANNYSLSSGSYTAANAAKINKADYTGTPSVTKDIVKNSAAVQSGTLTAADFFTTAPAGAKITAIAMSDTSLDVVRDISVADDGTLSYASKTGITAAEGDTYSITISSTNYKDIRAELKFRLVDKADAGVAIADDTASTTYGTNITITATKTTDKTGSWSWVYEPDYFEPVGATNGASVTLKPLKAKLNSGTIVTAKYEGNDVVGSDEISVTINKATLTVTAKDQSIQVGAEAPDLSSPVAGTHYTVSGLVNGDDLDVEMKYQKDGSDATPDTSAAGSYEIVIAADADASKYTINTVDGTLTIANRPAPPAASGKYRITVLDTVNGKAEADQRSAKAGETITVTVDPDAGYTVEDITILDRNGDKVKFRLKGGKYVFEMPASSVTVQVDFERSENPFVDVPEGKYFYDAVLWALDNGITGGTDATHFSPYASCTRGQLVTFLWRAIGEPAAKKGNTFSDVEKGRYCEKAVSWAAENEIVGGYDDGTFRPDATVTRQQTAAILWRFAKYAGMDVSVGEDTNILSYNDALTISDYAFPAIQWAVGAGIMGGNDGDLLPRGTCTRAQIVTMLYRCLAK